MPVTMIPHLRWASRASQPLRFFSPPHASQVIFYYTIFRSFVHARISCHEGKSSFRMCASPPIAHCTEIFLEGKWPQPALIDECVELCPVIWNVSEKPEQSFFLEKAARRALVCIKNAPLRDSVKLLSSKGEHSPALGLISVFLQIYLRQGGKTGLQFLATGDGIGHLAVVEPFIGCHIKVTCAGQAEDDSLLLAGLLAF